MVTYRHKICVRRRTRCDDDEVTRIWRIWPIWRIGVFMVLALATLAVSVPSAHVVATAPPTSTPSGAPSDSGPVATNDLLPQNNNIDNCVGTLESANCGSRARADGHTYLVFLALAVGMAFIGWRIARGVRARDAADHPAQ